MIAFHVTARFALSSLAFVAVIVPRFAWSAQSGKATVDMAPKPFSSPGSVLQRTLPIPPRVVPPSRPIVPLPMLPSVAQVKIEVLKTHVVVIEDITLPRGDWAPGVSLDFFVAFGAPGTPRAIDAHLRPLPNEDARASAEADGESAGESLLTSRTSHRTAAVYGLLGRDTMAGVVVHIPSESLENVFASNPAATLRVRTVLDLPDEDSDGARGLVVRLGASQGTPLTLHRIALAVRPEAGTLDRTEARLCGPLADGIPLAVSSTPKPRSANASFSSEIKASLAVRHATDDLCVRFWLAR